MTFQMSAAMLILAIASSAGVCDDGSTLYATDTGNLTVTYGQPAPRDYGTRPDFGELDADSSGSIDMSQARAYGLLDVDFDHADGTGNGGVSAREYKGRPRNR